MLFKTINGRQVDIPTARYRVDWERIVSKPQKAVKDFLRPYWAHDIVFEEMRVPGSKMRIDLVNVNKGVVVEVSPESSHSFNAFFHRGSLNRFKDALKRDLRKAEWARANEFAFVELNETDFPLTPAAFERQGVYLS